MDWIKSISNAINFIDDNLTNNITVKDVSDHVFASNSHFQRIFNVVTGLTIGEYIRNRRLSLAGQELFLTECKVTDIAFRYQYDTSESFSKAFSRFHGFSPTEVKKHGDKLKYFDPLTINIFIKGGFNMSRKIMENEQGIRLIREIFEYKPTGNLRFIGLDLRKNPGISIEDTIKKIAPLLDPLKSQYAWLITDYCYLEHHNGGEVNANETGIGGWFFKSGTPVPEGCIFYDVPTVNIGYGVYCGDESFGGDTFDAYVFTRDQILSDGIIIPYPEAYWTAVQFIDGEPHKGKYHFGYMFGVTEKGV
ncbi:MAG: hypothetical protein BGN88_09965 [Clostridiales bacterium 43-6]|nr:MAG: hypothetical protein BGN88_09965 [Clostridiales bacterium 43-6]